MNNFLPAQIRYWLDTRNWKLPLIIIFTVSFAGVAFIGYQTYFDAPPTPDFVDKNGKNIISQKNIEDGQKAFHHYSLMAYGSVFGDGAQRGPDFTAEALHLLGQAMKSYYTSPETQTESKDQESYSKLIDERIKIELKKNNYDTQTNQVRLSPAQVEAIQNLKVYYKNIFVQSTNVTQFPLSNYIQDEKVTDDLSAFFFWTAWVSVVQRPNTEYSYTHNWPFDPSVGNTPTTPTILWSVLGLMAFVLCCGGVLYYIGQYNQLSSKFFAPDKKDYLILERINQYSPTLSQKATFKFFVVAAILFLLQVSCGIFTLNDFINFFQYININLAEYLPVTVTRSWHTMLSIYWISTCWIASSIFILPILTGQEIQGQAKRINILFSMLFVLIVGSVVGVFLGPIGFFKDFSYWFGSQGWEFVEFGRAYQYLLMLSFLYWVFIIYKGLKPVLNRKLTWDIPHWIMYAVIGIPFLFISGFVAGPETNFVIADFWRWMVVHMWVEAFFEVFITVIISYLMVLMGLVNKEAAIRVIYFATILFLGTGLLGISHNFYWNAKPVATMALGSVFSTMQFVPLILLTVEAWRFKSMPHHATAGDLKGIQNFAFEEVFLFLIAVNFWNFFGAGVLGIIINLPIMNYYEHGTYLTVNHAHAALMGVYGNVSLAALIFSVKILTKPEAWNTRLLRFCFWCFNIGLMLMVILDLFPAGIIQLMAVIEKGLWYGRSHEFVTSGTFETLTWLRGIGSVVFFFGGVIPLITFLVLKMKSQKKAVSEYQTL